MARIRSIKPEFWTSEQVLECSPVTRLMFVGMWNFADDMGRMPCSPKSIKAQVFPSDDISLDTVRGMLNELSSNGLILIYAIEGKEYLQITGWSHQRIDKPQPAKYPAPFFDNSGNVPRVIPPDRKGEERIGKDTNPEANASGADAPIDPSIPEREFFSRGKEVLGKSSGGLLAKLLKSRGGNVALARSALETASQKENPAEYVAAVCRGPPTARASTVYQQRQAEGREILNEIDQSISRRSGADDPFALRHDTGDGRSVIRGGSGATLVRLPANADRSRG